MNRGFLKAGQKDHCSFYLELANKLYTFAILGVDKSIIRLRVLFMAVIEFLFVHITFLLYYFKFCRMFPDSVILNLFDIFVVCFAILGGQSVYIVMRDGNVRLCRPTLNIILWSCLPLCTTLSLK